MTKGLVPVMRTVKIVELVAELTNIYKKYGDTTCYVSGLAWGATALWAEAYAKSDDEMPDEAWLLKVGFVKKTNKIGHPYFSHATTTLNGTFEITVGLAENVYDVDLFTTLYQSDMVNSEKVFNGIGLVYRDWTTKRELRQLFIVLGIEGLLQKGWPADPRPDTFELEVWKPKEQEPKEQEPS